MTFSKIGDIIRSEKELDSVLKATFDYKVSETKSTLNYTGPQMAPEVWYQATSFLQWVFETTHSEGQVRFFLNPVKKEWVCWAFPQEAKTGMTAKELNTPERDKQRLALPDSEHLIFFGTVHSHCNCSAFQSGTDSHGTNNNDGEKDQDGLHITIGKMGEKIYDFHARFYVSKVEFSPKLDLFWDVGETIRQMVPANLLDQVARFQMCQKVAVAFPEQWKQNLIEIKPTYTVSNDDWRTRGYYQGGLGYSSSNHYDPASPEWERLQEACDEAVEEAMKMGGTEKEIRKVVNMLWQCNFLDRLFDAAGKFKVDPEEVLRELYINDASYLCEGMPVNSKKESRKDRKARLKAETEAKTAAAKAQSEERSRLEKQAEDELNPEHWEVAEYVGEDGKAVYYQVENPALYVQTKFKTEREAEVELQAKIRKSLEKRAKTKQEEPEWKPTHRVGTVMVMFNQGKGKYMRRDGWLWDWDNKEWVSPDGKASVKGDIGISVSALQGTPVNSNQKEGVYWDADAGSWVGNDGQAIPEHMIR